jgi:hypothetical protein
MNKTDDKKGKSKGAAKPEMIPISYFFRYLTPKEKFMLYFGTFSALIAGVLLPAVAIVMG